MIVHVHAHAQSISTSSISGRGSWRCVETSKWEKRGSSVISTDHPRQHSQARRILWLEKNGVAVPLSLSGRNEIYVDTVRNPSICKSSGNMRALSGKHTATCSSSRTCGACDFTCPRARDARSVPLSRSRDDGDVASMISSS